MLCSRCADRSLVVMCSCSVDQIKFLKTGNGLENLAAEHPEYDVVYAVVSQVLLLVITLCCEHLCGFLYHAY